jgi:hypothetical protein
MFDELKKRSGESGLGKVLSQFEEVFPVGAQSSSKKDEKLKSFMSLKALEAET